MGQNKTSKQLFYYFLLIIVSVIWGSGFIATQMAVDADLSSSFIMFNRFAVASTIMVVMFNKELKSLTAKQVKSGVIIGVLLFGGFYTQTIGIRYTTPANNAFLTAICVIMVPFLYWILSNKKPETKTIVSSFICLLGIGFLSIKLDQGLNMSFGDIITLAGAFFFACHIAAVAHYAKDLGTKKLMMLQMTTAMVLSFVVFVTDKSNFTAYTKVNGVLAVFYLGLMSTCICFFLLTYVQQFVSPTKTAIILTAEALFGGLFSVMLGFEAFNYQLLIGGGLIFTSVLITEMKMPILQKSRKKVLS